MFDRSITMNLAPEFAAHWLAAHGDTASDARTDRRDDDTSAQEAALEQLAERVHAARSVV